MGDTRDPKARLLLSTQHIFVFEAVLDKRPNIFLSLTIDDHRCLGNKLINNLFIYDNKLQQMDYLS